MAPNVNWKGLEEIGETRILDALRLALNGTSMADIARETGIPASSLSSIKCHGPYAHRNKGQSGPATV
jgi:transposase-like protein